MSYYPIPSRKYIMNNALRRTAYINCIERLVHGWFSVERMREFVNHVWEKVRSFSEGANIAGIEQS